MLISYHIKAELCTLFDKVHKAFINSANAPRLCTFYRLPTVCLSADTAAQPVEARLALPGRGMFAMTWRGMPPPDGGGKRGRDTKVSLPLLTPQPFLRTRLPAVARLKARGPQGRLMLQGYTLDGSGAFRSGTLPPCTGWPRTVMRGKSRKLTSGPESVPKSARRTEPSPRNPRFAAHLRCVSAKEGLGSQEGTGNHTWCPVPFCPSPWARRFPPVNTGPPRRRRRPLSTPSEGVKPPPAAHRCIGGRSTVSKR